jgi:antitoxin (DNA-binding transcriptional repressor) of toxin-antitoxin stability system
MKRASITEAKNSLSALIDGLESGAPVLIIDRGRPVARLESVTSTGPGDGGADGQGRLARLVRAGVARPRRAPPPRGLFASEPPAAASALAALLEERRRGR